MALLMHNMNKSSMDRHEIEKKANLLWGGDLHKEKAVPAHCNQVEDIFKEKWTHAMQGSLLEIGCGSGSDLKVFLKNKRINHLTAIDLGSNIERLSEKFKERQNIDIKRGNALSLEFDDNQFDVIYSFGVFHHTADPIRCIKEAKRVLKNNGKIFLYLYSAHEDMLLKRIGIILEKITMRFIKIFPYSFQSLICIFLSPFCWMLFSIPSHILRLLGFKVFAKKFPFYFGTHPFSLIGDLKDRLMSPINHRFSRLEMENIFILLDFKKSEIVKTSSGLYIYAEK